MVSDEMDHFVMEEKVGPVPIRVELGSRPLIWLGTPPIEYGRKYDLASLCRLECPEHLAQRCLTRYFERNTSVRGSRVARTYLALGIDSERMTGTRKLRESKQA